MYTFCTAVQKKKKNKGLYKLLTTWERSQPAETGYGLEKNDGKKAPGEDGRTGNLSAVHKFKTQSKQRARVFAELEFEGYYFLR